MNTRRPPKTPECWDQDHGRCGNVVCVVGTTVPRVTYCACHCHGVTPEALVQAIRETVAMLHDIPLKFVRAGVEDTHGAVD